MGKGHVDAILCINLSLAGKAETRENEMEVLACLFFFTAGRMGKKE